MTSVYAKRFDSVRENKEFQTLFKRGQSIVVWGFVCYYRVNNRTVNRCGIVTGKKIGNAIKRNRAKRVIMAAFLRIEPLLREKTAKRYDFIFVARAKTPYVKSSQLYTLMKRNILDKLK